MMTRQTTAVKAPAIAIATYQSVPVIGLGTYAPPSFTQRETLAALGLEGNAFAEEILANAGIATRNFSIPPVEIFRDTSLGRQASYFREHAPRMAAEALRRAAGTTIELATIDAVVTATSSGYMMPGLSEVLCGRYGIGRPDGLRYDLVGHGCLAMLPAVQMGRALIASNQAKRVAVVCSEPQAAMYNPTDSSKTTIVQNMIFGEGAAALILQGHSEGDQHLPAFLDFEQELAPETLETVGVKQGNVWESTLDRSVPEIVGRILPGVIERLLGRHALRLADVSHWAFHTGGRRVLEVSQQGLGLSDAQMAPSYEVLRRHGNMGSGTVIHSLAEVLSSSRPAPGELGLLVSVGPGMVIGAALVCWEGN